MSSGYQERQNVRTSQRAIFCSIAAQHDNLGDIAIRQTAIEWLGDDTRQMVIYTGAMPPSYVEAFNLPASAQLVSSSRKFATKLLAACIRRNAHIVFAPGPFQLRPGRRSVSKSVVNLLNIIVVRLSGGHALALGRAVRGTAQPVLAIERLSIRLMDLFVVRDLASADAVGRPLRSAPDMAFGQALATLPRTDRVFAAISLRGDRPVNLSLIETMLKKIRAASLVPIFVTQVMRDNDQHALLAEKYGAQFCGWDNESHSEQLLKVDAIYAQSHTVVSDRLHSLIFALRRGVFPIGLERARSDKLSSTLGHLVPLALIDPEQESLPPHFALETDETKRRSLIELVARAQDALHPIRNEARALL